MQKQPQAPDEEIRARSESGRAPEQDRQLSPDQGEHADREEQAMEKAQEDAADEREDVRGYQ